MRSENRLPLLDVMHTRLRPPESRRGSGSGRLWWHCPFHPDKNPSLTILPGGSRWRCFGCGSAGDSIDLIRRLDPGLSFAAAKSEAEGSRSDRHPPATTRSENDRSDKSPGWQVFARTIADVAIRNLWSESGSLKALAYLRGRGLGDETIHAAGLGYWPADTFHRDLAPDRPVLVPRGITIPWQDGSTIEALNIRRPAREGEKRKYHLLRGSRRTLYPGRGAIVAGRPLILCEGEFDCLLLGQEVGNLASVVTLGSASDRRPDTAVRLAMASASPWYVAGDDDSAGQANAADWLLRSGRCRRIIPPEGDWTDAHKAGYRLGEWWAEILAGRDPYRFDPVWYELAALWRSEQK